jgi:5'-nucleotidase
MKNLFTCLAALTLAVAVIGCAKNDAATTEGGDPALNPSVADVGPGPVPPREPGLAYTAPAASAPAAQPAEPVWAEPSTPAPAVTETPAAAAPAAPAPAAGGKSYTVKKGDTLFSIAKEVYGNGNQWQRLTAANPGLSPSTLKVGQKIAIP